MNQEKVRTFIAECRKKKKLTQAELASKLGVSEKSISNWENGRNMPDLSLFKPLCNELDITINELLSGEKLKEDNYQEKFEENIINTIDYGNKKLTEKNNVIGIILIVCGLLMTFTAMNIFASESSWGSVYSTLGAIISLIGVSKFTKNLTYFLRLIINFGYLLFFIIVLFLIDYIGVLTIKQPPRFATSKKTIYNMIIYETPFYNLYRLNFDTENEYYILDKEKKYTEETIPNVPFDRDETGIDNLIKYKSKKYDSDKVVNLIYDLPLSNLMSKYEFKNDLKKIIITYQNDEWFINENYYFERSLIYNSVSLFMLLDYVNEVSYVLNNVEYYVTRDIVEENFPNFDLVVKDGINKENFNLYVEQEILRDNLLTFWFKEFFIDQNIKDTTKIVLKNYDDKILNTITDKNKISEVLELINRSKMITGVVNADGNWWVIYFYKDNEELLKLIGWGNRSGYGSSFGFDRKSYLVPGLDGTRLQELLIK